MNTTTQTAIPEIAWKHIKIEVAKVARRFHLNPDDRADLESEIRCEVRLAVAMKYSPEKGKVYTFIQRVVHNQLCKWMAKEYERREDICTAAIEAQRRADRRRLRSVTGPNDSVDDTTYSDEDRWDFGEEFPEAVSDIERTWDTDGLRRLLLVADVRHVVSEMEGRSKRICELFLEELSLREINKRLRCGSRQFFMKMWPQAKAEFRAKSEELGKHFEER